MPIIIAVLGYIVGGGLMILGIIGFLRKRKPSGAILGTEPVAQSTSNDVKLDKFTLVARAIMEAKIITPSGKDVIVYITDSNGLSRILPQEIKSILIKFQDDEKVILLKLFPEWWWPQASKEIYHSRQPKVAVKYVTDEEYDATGAAKLGFKLPDDWKLRLKKGDTGVLDVFFLSPRGITYRISKFNPDGSMADYEAFNSDGKTIDFSRMQVDPSKKHFIVDTLDTFDKWYKATTKK